MITIAAPIIGDEEVAAVNAVLKSGILAQGPKVSELEEAFATYCGTKYAVAVNSGTAALHCALHAAGVGPGDEVITTSFTFMATFNTILMTGAIPVLVDIRAEDFNIDPALVEKAITPKTKAIIGVDLYGQVYDYDALKKIADDHKLALIEDACQAIGAHYDGKPAGSLSDIACFSLYATKNIMSGEGGVVTTNDENVVASIKRFRQHGMTASYDYAELGYNYRLTDLCAAIAVEQLKKVDDFTAARRRNAGIFNEGLASLKGIILPTVMPKHDHVYHQYTIRLTKDAKATRDVVIAHLKDRGIGSGVYYPKALSGYPHVAKFGFKDGGFPVAEQMAREVLALPVHPRVSEDDARKIIAVLQGVL